MTNLLLDYILLAIIFGLWILLDSWAIVWREGFWKPPGQYIPELSKSYVNCLLVVFGLLSAALILLTSRYELILAVILAQQAGTEDIGYWLIGTTVFKKDWSFTETGKFLIPYPKKWPWLNGMPILKFFSHGEASFWGLVRSVVFAHAAILMWLAWVNFVL